MMDDTHLIEIQRLFEIVHRRGLRELSLTRPDFAITIHTVPTVGIEAHPPTVHLPVPCLPAKMEEPAAPVGHEIASPLVGTFYRSSSPDSPSFVEVGDQVEFGQPLCIVEAMKVFNEITADRAGTVIAIPAQNGQLVQVGQVLVVLDDE
jgi:acetyl-CoA carboxylase biotin carboxyl carrier protein